MITRDSLLVHYRQLLINRILLSTVFYLRSFMSKSLRSELDLKIQQMKEYGRIMHGYQNENFQYPIHVRRSHDGERLGRNDVEKDRRPIRLTSPVLFTSISDDNRTKIKSKDRFCHRPYSYDDQRFVVPPNKTIGNERLTISSSPILNSIRPHSIAGLSSTCSDDQSSSSSSSQSHQTLTRRFLRKIFHYQSKS